MLVKQCSFKSLIIVIADIKPVPKASIVVLAGFSDAGGVAVW